MAARVLCVIFRGRKCDEAFCKSQRDLRGFGLAGWVLGGFLRLITRVINHRLCIHHLTERRESAHRMSAVLLTDAAFSTCHMHSICELPVLEPQSPMTPRHHMSLSDRPPVCFSLQDRAHFLCSLCFRTNIKKTSFLNTVFTLCERFEGKHKAATQWVDYKLGPSFKHAEFINTEFPQTRVTGPSLHAYYCGSNADEEDLCIPTQLCARHCFVTTSVVGDDIFLSYFFLCDVVLSMTVL